MTEVSLGWVSSRAVISIARIDAGAIVAERQPQRLLKTGCEAGEQAEGGVGGSHQEPARRP